MADKHAGAHAHIRFASPPVEDLHEAPQSQRYSGKRKNAELLTLNTSEPN